jgi:hypothetical protein
MLIAQISDPHVLAPGKLFHAPEEAVGECRTMSERGTCLWCDRTFQPRRGGSRQRFCSARYRAEFHSAARRFAERGIAAGVLTVADTRNGARAACTLLLTREATTAVTTTGWRRTCLSVRPRWIPTRVTYPPVERARRPKASEQGTLGPPASKPAIAS